MIQQTESSKEMNGYTNYLIGTNADEQSLLLFEKASHQPSMQLSEREKKLLHFVLQHKWGMGCVDAAMGIFTPKHPIRKRMITAFAILETNPMYFSFFKPRSFHLFYFFILSAKAILHVVKALTGRIILALV